MQPEIPENIPIIRLGERAFELRPEAADPLLIRTLSELIRSHPPERFEDLIAAYDRIGVIFSEVQPAAEPFQQYLGSLRNKEVRIPEPEIYEISVDYEKGLDWDVLTEQSGLSKAEIIELHSSQEYEVAATGFLPGFVYLNGLPEILHCPRRSDPRRSVPAGSVGIGGSHTGIYSLSSPGGWQIIGQSYETLFDADKEPPMQLKPGDKVRFVPASVNKEQGA